MLSDSRIFKQHDSDASEWRPAGDFPPFSSPDMLSERGGTDVSISQATPPPLDVSPFVSTHAIPGTSYPPVSFSPVPPYPPL